MSETKFRKVVLLGALAAILPLAMSARASMIVCRPINCGRVCTDDPIDGHRCGDWQCDTECTVDSGGGGGGTGGMGGTIEPGGSHGGNGGTDPSTPAPMPQPEQPQCTQCNPATSSGPAVFATSSEPSQCTDTSSAGCEVYCDALSTAKTDACRSRARNTGGSCLSLLYQNLGTFCTQTVNGGVPYSSSDVGQLDLGKYAPDVCPSNSWHVSWFTGRIIANPTCYADVAVAKTAGERADCRDELMSGSGSYFDSAHFGFKISVPGFGEFSGDIGHGQNTNGQSGDQVCQGLMTQMTTGCAIASGCMESKCPETPDSTGHYKDGSSCTPNVAAGGGGGSN